eukprot:scaffold380_cov272-Pinguiococcus_pyrenoidosus.AAC.1
MFTAGDGTKFSSRQEYRKYEMERLSFCDREGAALLKRPGEIAGQSFILADLRDCTVALCDFSDQVTVDNAENCRLLVAASSGAVFLRNCTNCEVSVASKQLRTRDCHDCVMHLYCKTEPVIETSSAMRFGNFDVAYQGHADHLARAQLTPEQNLWFAVFDFNDEARTGQNWSLLAGETQASLQVWRPLDDGAALAIPVSEPGRIAVPSASGTGDAAGKLMSFTFDTTAEEAAQMAHMAETAQTAQPTRARDSGSGEDKDVLSDTDKRKDRGKASAGAAA